MAVEIFFASRSCGGVTWRAGVVAFVVVVAVVVVVLGGDGPALKSAPATKLTRSAAAPSLLDDDDGEVDAGEEPVAAVLVTGGDGCSPDPIQLDDDFRAGGVDAAELDGEALGPRGRRALRVIAALVRATPAVAARPAVRVLEADATGGRDVVVVKGTPVATALGFSARRPLEGCRGSLAAWVVTIALSIELVVEGGGVWQSIPGMVLRRPALAKRADWAMFLLPFDVVPCSSGSSDLDPVSPGSVV
jgi:hypothetical protein